MALVWPSRWGTSKVLFFANRYLAIVDPVMLVYGAYLRTNPAHSRESNRCLPCAVLMFGSGRTVRESVWCCGRGPYEDFVGVCKRVSGPGR